MIVILPRKGYNVTVTPLGDDADGVGTDDNGAPPALPDPPPIQRQPNPGGSNPGGSNPGDNGIPSALSDPPPMQMSLNPAGSNPERSCRKKLEQRRLSGA